MLTADDDKRVSPCCGFTGDEGWESPPGSVSQGTVLRSCGLAGQALPHLSVSPLAELEEFGNSQYWLWGLSEFMFSGQSKMFPHTAL